MSLFVELTAVQELRIAENLRFLEHIPTTWMAVATIWLPDEDPYEILSMQQGVSYCPVLGNRCTTAVMPVQDMREGQLTYQIDFAQRLEIPNFVSTPEYANGSLVLFVSIFAVQMLIADEGERSSAVTIAGRSDKFSPARNVIDDYGCNILHPKGVDILGTAIIPLQGSLYEGEDEERIVELRPLTLFDRSFLGFVAQNRSRIDNRSSTPLSEATKHLFPFLREYVNQLEAVGTLTGVSVHLSTDQTEHSEAMLHRLNVETLARRVSVRRGFWVNVPLMGMEPHEFLTGELAMLVMWEAERMGRVELLPHCRWISCGRTNLQPADTLGTKRTRLQISGLESDRGSIAAHELNDQETFTIEFNGLAELSVYVGRSPVLCLAVMRENQLYCEAVVNLGKPREIRNENGMRIYEVSGPVTTAGNSLAGTYVCMYVW
eukprot:GHVU01184345.1.p1 GENE.GHVU01184345.1~~GHVU01184345.1.p1  ORF type:complete len:433 (-),score=25.80 GHVU01184345.1:355-1653(-)